jgi:ornithine carbamoyltransferase
MIAIMPSPIATTTAATGLLTGAEWGPSQVKELLQLAAEVKAHPDRYRGALSDRYIMLIFEKPSLRTRIAFEVGIANLGGRSIFLDHTAARLGQRESLPDMARSLESWVHAVVARVFLQSSLDELASCARVPVINALSDKYHPCQALSDLFTLEEVFGGLRGLKIAWVGDGNNVCHSLIVMAARAGVHLRVATPRGYQPSPDVISDARRVARETRGKIDLFHDPAEAVAGAQAVYTDVWTSMGQEDEDSARRGAFAGFQVNETLMALASPDAVFMHCLPAHRGLEVTDAVIDSAASIVFEQAANRLHAQKAILLMLLN